MEKKNNHTKKQIELHNEVIEKLQVLAKKKGWKLKPYMEYVLEKKSEIVK
jgi:macrodomain Ter protein organizer (MatP/YcbG family)